VWNHTTNDRGPKTADRAGPRSPVIGLFCEILLIDSLAAFGYRFVYSLSIATMFYV
jgi:hypothetical protein